MGEVQLIGARRSPFQWRVIWALKLKGIDYTYIEEDLTNKSELLLKYNPIHKKIPVLVHNGKPIAESPLILEYIDETWPQKPLLPKDPYERSVARFWSKLVDDKISSLRAFFLTTGESQEKATADLQGMLEAVEEQSGFLQKTFSGGDDELELVDLIYGSIAHWLIAMEEAAGVKLIEPHKFPRLCAWIKNFYEVPLIKENLPPARDELAAFYKQWREKTLGSS